MRGRVYSSQAETRRLCLRFTSPEAFWEEYERNIAKGGAFISCEEPFELRETVRVDLDLVYRDRTIVLDAEIVHVVAPPLARVGGTPGVAVEFLEMATKVREQLAPFVEEAKEAARLQAEAAPVLSSGDLEAEAIDPSAVDLSEGLPLTPPPPERRQAPREPTWVQARVMTPNGTFEGRTRDIGREGVLVSLEGDEVPIATPVQVRLSNPRSGDALEVKGTVVRHVEGEGRVAAIAVSFQPSPEQYAEVTRFVEQLWSADRARRLGGIEGDVSALGVANLLEMFGKSAPHGTLAVRRHSEEGIVAFESGLLRYARLGGLSGVKALARMLSWQEGAFEFHAHVDPLEQEDPPGSLDGKILEALRQIDEAKRVQPDAMDPTAQVNVDPERADALRAELDKTEAAVLDLAEAGFTIRKILDVIPEPDASVFEALKSLCDQQIVRVRS